MSDEGYCHYRVIQFQPDLIAREVVNVGIVVYVNGRGLFRFLGSWERAEAFAGEDLDWLREYLRDFEQLQEDDAVRTTNDPYSPIRLTEPRGSLRPPREVLTDVGDYYLIEPGRRLPAPVPLPVVHDQRGHGTQSSSRQKPGING